MTGFTAWSIPALNCRRCPRLVAYRKHHRKTHSDWHNGAVAPLGRSSARLLIVGLAPGLKGAHRTGQVFTGDSSGAFLFRALLAAGLARGHYDPDRAGTIELVDTVITNAVACAPPANKPELDEFAKCALFLERQIRQMHDLRVILTLGHHAHRAVLRHFSLSPSQLIFAHGATHTIDGQKAQLINSYHCSRYNTQTGRLTPTMFDDILRKIKILMASYRG